MSLENVISENTKAINNLAEIIRQAMRMTPTAPAPVTPQAVPDNGVYVPQKPAPVPENPPFVAPVDNIPQPQIVVEPVPAPAPAAPADPVNYKELRKALMQKVMGLFAQSRDVGKQILSSFGAQKLSDIPDDKLVAFAASVDKALAGV